jgi:hypothetical protein
MSKINLSLNYDKIRGRIDIDKSLHKPAEWAKKVGVSKNIVTNIHGATKQKPSLEYIVAVSRVTGKPIEWYLYGHTAYESRASFVAEQNADHQTESNPKGMGKWPVDIIDACHQLKDILLSDNHAIKTALISILAASQICLENEKSQEEKIRMLSRRLLKLENWHKAEQDTGTEGAASSSTGKPRM